MNVGALWKHHLGAWFLIFIPLITGAPSCLVPLNFQTRWTKVAVHSVDHLLIYTLFMIFLHS